MWGKSHINYSVNADVVHVFVSSSPFRSISSIMVSSKASYTDRSPFLMFCHTILSPQSRSFRLTRTLSLCPRVTSRRDGNVHPSFLVTTYKDIPSKMILKRLYNREVEKFWSPIKINIFWWCVDDIAFIPSFLFLPNFIHSVPDKLLTFKPSQSQAKG